MRVQTAGGRVRFRWILVPDGSPRRGAGNRGNVDAVSIAVVLMAGGYAVNGTLDRVRRMRNERRREQEKALRGPEPVCGCGHHLAYHDLRDGRCYAQVKSKGVGGSDGGGKAKGATAAQCTCRRYAGPEPLATLYAPELTSDSHPPLEPPAA